MANRSPRSSASKKFPDSIARLQKWKCPEQLGFVAKIESGRDSGQILIHETGFVMKLEINNCKEHFLISPPIKFHRSEIINRLSELEHRPCFVPSDGSKWRTDGFEIVSAHTAGTDDEKTIWCLFSKEGVSRLAATRTFVSSTLTEAEALNHCRYLLHVALRQSDPLPVQAIPVAHAVEDPSDSESESDDESSLRKKPRIKTVITQSVDELKFEANRPGLCSDNFRGFNINSWVDEDSIKQIVRESGYSRCAMSASGPDLSIGSNYKYVKVEVSEMDGFRELHCVFAERKLRNAAKIDLRRRSPMTPDMADEAGKSFNSRMRNADERSQKDECKAILNSFIKIQNKLYQAKFKSKELADVLLPEIEDVQSRKKSEGLSFGIVFLIIALVAVALVAGFYLWRHYKPSQPKSRGRRSQRVRREITDI